MPARSDSSALHCKSLVKCDNDSVWHNYEKNSKPPKSSPKIVGPRFCVKFVLPLIITIMKLGNFMVPIWPVPAFLLMGTASMSYGESARLYISDWILRETYLFRPPDTAVSLYPSLIAQCSSQYARAGLSYSLIEAFAHSRHPPLPKRPLYPSPANTHPR